MPVGQAFTPSIRIDNISVMRGGRPVLRDFSLSAKAGDIIWIRGANGCGKSTLLRLIAGLLHASKGVLAIEGKIGLCDENPGCDSGLPVAKALKFWADMDGIPESGMQEAMRTMHLDMLADIPVRYLSTGQRRRTALARTIGSGADIWLLDEPYNGLDSANVTRLDGAILHHGTRGGIALVAAHQPPAINISDQIILDRYAVDMARP